MPAVRIVVIEDGEEGFRVDSSDDPLSADVDGSVDVGGDDVDAA